MGYICHPEPRSKVPWDFTGEEGNLQNNKKSSSSVVRGLSYPIGRSKNVISHINCYYVQDPNLEFPR